MILAILENSIDGKFHPVLLEIEFGISFGDTKFKPFKAIIYTYMVNGCDTKEEAFRELDEDKELIEIPRAKKGVIPWDGKNHPSGVVYFQTSDDGEISIVDS